MARFHHLAVRVDDLRAAEEHYAALFGAVVAFREVLRGDGWTTFPDAAGWEDFSEAGVQPDMAALRIGDFEMALLVGEPVGVGSLDHIALAVEPELLPAIAAAAEELECLFEHRSDDYLMLVDRYGIGWELSPDRGQAGPMAPVGRRQGRIVEL